MHSAFLTIEDKPHSLNQLLICVNISWLFPIWDNHNKIGKNIHCPLSDIGSYSVARLEWDSLQTKVLGLFIDMHHYAQLVLMFVQIVCHFFGLVLVPEQRPI